MKDAFKLVSWLSIITVKRSIIIAAERVDADHAESPLDLTNQDFDQAIHELVVFGGTPTSNVLGFVED
jgi:hypothetical protein